MRPPSGGFSRVGVLISSTFGPKEGPVAYLYYKTRGSLLLGGVGPEVVSVGQMCKGVASRLDSAVDLGLMER